MYSTVMPHRAPGVVLTDTEAVPLRRTLLVRPATLTLSGFGSGADALSGVGTGLGRLRNGTGVDATFDGASVAESLRLDPQAATSTATAISSPCGNTHGRR